jgi:serine/threonine-protein kinase
MAVVWLARDLKHERPVALKVLRPELSAVIGADRFRREIRLTAGLQHPNILPLHDSGEAAGFLYYVMPFVEGETLRDRLAREGALPTADAVRLAGEIGGALSHAHRHGIVHRDVKPENVLLADGHALVADFGIARAEGGERLTETGMAIGTPSYMSPEQGAGDVTDERSDQYALAAVTYELLAGEPPFTGPTAQSVMAKHVAQPAPSIRTTRPAVPMHVDVALQRALAKQPADRFADVADFVDALLHAPALETVAGAVPRRGRAGRSAMLATAFAAIVLALGWWLTHRGGWEDAAYDADAVAVVPFRVEGADPSLGYLGEGMVDLVAAKLPGGGGLRAVAPRATLAAWRSETTGGAGDPARAVARRLHAGLVLDGSVVGAPSRVTLSATLRDAASGASVGSGQAIGPADSLPVLVDRLVVALLAGRSRVTSQQLAGMSSLPALREYLAGVAAHRAARYDEAVKHFDAALQEDSTFALAALAAVPAAWRQSDPGGIGVIEARAFRMRTRLQGADSIVLHALLGDTVPDRRTILGTIADLEQAVAVLPDRVELWFELGDRQLHFGVLQDYPDALPRAKRSLERALALDSAYGIAVDHLLLLALHERDSFAAARLAPLFQRTGSRGDAEGAFDWLLAELLNDSAAMREVRARIPSMPTASLFWLGAMPQLETGGIDVSTMAVAQAERNASTVGEARRVALAARALALNAGRPTAAERASQRAVESGGPPAFIDFVRVVAAHFWDGDRAAGEAALHRLATTPGDPRDQANDAPGWSACAEGLQGVATDDADRVARAAARFRALSRNPVPEPTADNRRLCASVLEAALAVSSRRADAPARLAYADSLFIFSPVSVYWYYTLVVARLNVALGDPAAALHILRRRWVGVDGNVAIALLSPGMREEGRLAEMLGDTAGAIRAYRHYLSLRAEPEPALVPQRDSVRATLGALLGEPRTDLSPPR